MALSYLPYILSIWLFIVGLYGIVTSKNLIHQVNCLSVIEASTYVLMLSIGYRAKATAPIFFNIPPGTPAVDPVVQALTLTGVVVGAMTSALLLAITIQAYKRFATLDPEELVSMKG